MVTLLTRTGVEEEEVVVEVEEVVGEAWVEPMSMMIMTTPLTTPATRQGRGHGHRRGPGRGRGRARGAPSTRSLMASLTMASKTSPLMTTAVVGHAYNAFLQHLSLPTIRPKPPPLPTPPPSPQHCWL